MLASKPTKDRNGKRGNRFRVGEDESLVICKLHLKIHFDVQDKVTQGSIEEMSEFMSGPRGGPHHEIIHHNFKVDGWVMSNKGPTTFTEQNFELCCGIKGTSNDATLGKIGPRREKVKDYGTRPQIGGNGTPKNGQGKMQLSGLVPQNDVVDHFKAFSDVTLPLKRIVARTIGMFGSDSCPPGSVPNVPARGIVEKGVREIVLFPGFDQRSPGSTPHSRHGVIKANRPELSRLWGVRLFY